MDVIPAVKNHRRRKGREQSRPNHRSAAQPVGYQGEKQHQTDAKQHRQEAQPGFSKVREVRRAGQRRQGECGIREGRPVMLVGIVLVAISLPELAEFEGIDRFVIVHRPLIQPSAAKPEGQRQNQDKKRG